MRTYAVPDIHGRFDLLNAAIEWIENHQRFRGGEYRIVFLGDYVDRGPDSAQVLLRLWRGQMLEKKPWVVLKGNHEQMMLFAQNGGEKSLMQHWIGNGGKYSLESFARSADLKQNQDAVFSWVETLPKTFFDAKRIFVHAGLNYGRPIQDQDEDELLWKYNADTDNEYCGLHVVHGHEARSGFAHFFPGRSNFDARAYFTGKLCVGIFDYEKAGPIGYAVFKGPVYEDIMQRDAMPEPAKFFRALFKNLSGSEAI